MDTLLSSAAWPFIILFLAVGFVILMISRLRFHPFVALIFAAIFVGLLSQSLPEVKDQHPLVTAIELPMIEFGVVAGKIAWVIALAAIIGTAMMESGAAERIVNALLKLFGENRAAVALLISGFVLSIPVFFDTVFFLLIPLAIALALKTGKNYVLYVIAISGGAVITHSLVPPTPGPLIMADRLQIDLGMTILAGMAAGIIPAIVVLILGKRMEARFQIPVRLEMAITQSDQKGPGLMASLTPIVLPVILISLVSILEAIMGKGQAPGWIAFLGNKNIAMAIGTAIALYLWARQKQLNATSLWEASAKPLQIAGIIILITSAGGAFGAMIMHSGIGDAIKTVTQDFHIHYVILAWIIAAVMKTAQGSGTVSMITTSAIMFSIIGTGQDLSYHPMYILLAIGFGSGFISWMNDSGFWVVAKMSGFTEKEALQTWTVMLGIISLIGLFLILIMSFVLPFR